MTVWDDARKHFASCLAEVHRAANSPSLADLERLGEKQRNRKKKKLHPSTVSDLLNAKFMEPPDWDLIDLFVRTCKAIASQPTPQIPQLFDDKLWKNRHAALEQVWQLVRQSETKNPADLRPFPLKEAQPLAADLHGQPSQPGLRRSRGLSGLS